MTGDEPSRPVLAENAGDVRRLGWQEYTSEPSRHPQQIVADVRPRLNGPGYSVQTGTGEIITFAEVRERELSEYDAARIFLEKPDNPRSDHGRRLAVDLGRAYGITPEDVRDIWATKAMKPGKPNCHRLSQWQTDALPPFFPDPSYPDPDDLVPRRQRQPPPARIESPSLDAPDAAPLWGPRSTTKFMELNNKAPHQYLADDDSPAPTPRYPMHKLHQRCGAAVKTVACERGMRPPVGHIDLVVVECLNLAVPHKFTNFWNLESIRPNVQVELVERGSKTETIQFLTTTTMSRSKLAPLNRSPIDPVFNETCRFQALHLSLVEGDAVARADVLVSVMEADSSKCLGSVSIPVADILHKRGAPFYTWYHLMKPASPGDKTGFQPVVGSDPARVSCIQVPASMHVCAWHRESRSICCNSFFFSHACLSLLPALQEPCFAS
jgi:hypothetical protein